MAKRKDKTKCVFDMFHKEKVCDIPKTLGEYVDPMDKLRPNKKHARDYNLSQTFAIMDKGAVKLRYTDTHGEYEWYPADYVPPPPKKRHQRGRGPLEELLDEIWAKVVERQQLRVKIMNANKWLAAETARIEEIRKCKAKVTKKVGPDWYQELSSYQRYTVDRLSMSILWDLKNNSIVCTTQSLSDIGITCKHKHIAFALKECCSCPSEFLLILYQLIDPKRTAYSTTDRLLLSSIVHLSMRDTLKELHTRIPSPPPKRKRVRRSKKEEDRGKCKSPYLDKYLYRPRPIIRKWGKPDKEYPKNEYFSYVRELRHNTIYIHADEEIPEIPKFDRSKISENTDCYNCALIEMELKLVREWVNAQKVYNKMAKSKRVPALHKASVYASCLKQPEEDVSTTEEGSEDLLEEEEKKEEDPEVAKPADADYVCAESICPCDKISISAKEEEEAEEHEEEGEQEKEEKEEEDFVCKKYAVRKMLEIKSKQCGCCSCKEMILQKIKETQCQCKECEEERRRKNTISIPVIFDTTADDSGKPLKIISEVKSKTICTCLEKYTAKWKRHERRMDIKQAQDDLKSLEKKFVIKGLTIGPDGKPIYILEGVKEKDTCACFNNEKFKEEDKRKAALMPKMPEGCIKYVVSGVHSTPDGNVYIISGTTPNPDCQCMDVYNKFMENHALCLLLYNAYIKKVEIEKEEYFKELSKDYADFIPKSCVEEEEVPRVSCDDENNICLPCEKTKEGDQKYQPALLKSDQPDEIKCPYAKNPCVELPKSCQLTGIQCDEEPKEKTCSCAAKECVKLPKSCQLTGIQCDEEPKGTTCPYATEPKSCQLTRFQSGEEPKETCQLALYQSDETPEATCQLARYQCETELEEKCQLAAYQCVETPEGAGSICSSKSTFCKCDEDSTDDDNRDLERYIILKEFPREEKEQYTLLKKALAKLAEDGFPLAILPEAYRLPHFRIWLKMRSKKFWTQENKLAVLIEANKLCCKIDGIRDKPRLPGNNFLRGEPEKHNWNYRPLIKKGNEKIRTIFYRDVKKIELNYARMFYPTTYAYEFPSKSFRDVYFSYMPSKEADILAYNIWKRHEYREHIKRSCNM